MDGTELPVFRVLLRKGTSHCRDCHEIAVRPSISQRLSHEFPFLHLFFRVIGYFRQEFFIVFKFWLVGVVLSIIVSCEPATFCFFNASGSDRDR